MSDEPGAQFGVSDQAVLDLVSSLEAAGAEAIVDAFPAALLAPAWRALLDAGAIEAPTRVDLGRVEVVVTGPKGIELRVPVRTGDGTLVKSVPVRVPRWTSTGELASQLHDQASALALALDAAASQPAVDLGGQGQKPRN